MSDKIRVVIADDSAFLRQVLTDVLTVSGAIEIVAAAKNGKEAVEFVKKHKPDVLILDVEMPVMTGLQALRIIMFESPLPVFMFSSLTFEGASVTIKALEYGAVDFLPKPTGGAHQLESVADELIRKIKYIAIRHRASLIAKKGAVPKKPPVMLSSVTIKKKTVDLIAMGSSTGGVQAAMKVVPKLPENTKPIVWVQHMPPNFTKSFAQRLDGLSKMKVKEAEDGDKVGRGVCYLAAGGRQMGVVKRGADFYIKVGGTERVSGHCPSCNYLFSTLEQYCRNNMIGVILTGMGDDGAEGLLKLHNKGAYVIGQNEQSCVVYGMPKVANKIGAVDVELDINEIADAIVKAGGAD